MDNQFIVGLTIDELKRIINDCVLNAISKIPQPRIEDSTLLKRVDIAKMFSISLVTLTQWMKSGRIPFHRINSRIFFKKDEVIRAMELSPRYKRLHDENGGRINKHKYGEEC